MTAAEDGTAREPPTPRRRRRRRIVTVTGLLVTLGLAITAVVWWNRVTVQPVSMDAALRRAGLDSGPSAPAAPLLPAEGVYRYRGQGTEHLDKPPKTQPQGPDIPGTVTHLGSGCWRFRVDYNTNHWQSWDYCATSTGLNEKAGAFFQRLDLGPAKVDTTSTYTCKPAAVAIRLGQGAGDEWRHSCVGTSTSADGEVTSAGPYTFVGEEHLNVDRRRVAVLHYRRARTLGGGQSGTEEVDTWFDATTGLPVKNSRIITVHSGSVLGGVTYTERGSFTLISSTPSR